MNDIFVVHRGSRLNTS